MVEIFQVRTHNKALNQQVADLKKEITHLLGELEDERQHKEKLNEDYAAKEESWKLKGEAL